MSQDEYPRTDDGTLSSKAARKVGEALGEDWRDDVARAEAQEKFSGWPRHLPRVRQFFMLLHVIFLLSAIGVLAYQGFQWLGQKSWPAIETGVLLQWLGAGEELFFAHWPLALSLFITSALALIFGTLWLRLVEDKLYGPFEGEILPGYRR